MNFLSWLQETSFVQFLAADPYVYPALLCLHAIGMAMVVGLVLVMSARVIGLAPGLSTGTFDQFSTIALWGFAVNAASGALIFATEATRVIVNAEFLIKLACILIGAFAIWYMLRSARDLRAKNSDGAALPFPVSTRIVAVAASAAWLLAIVFGRQIAYTIKPPFMT